MFRVVYSKNTNAVSILANFFDKLGFDEFII